MGNTTRVTSGALAALAASMFACAEADAQTMYRCGNKYQDRPCDAGQKGKAVGSTGVGAPSAAAGAVVDADCVRRGKDSLKIVWSREGGASQEQLLEEIDRRRGSESEKAFVRDVYRRPGSAGSVQSAVEADCVVEKEKAARAAALMDAALKAQAEANKGAPPPAPVVQGAPAGGADPERLRAEADARRAEREKRDTCARLTSQMNSLRADERRGGSIATMERLNERRRSLQAQANEAGGCSGI